MLAGAELRKQRRLGEVLSDSFSIMGTYWRQLAAISVPVVAANIAISLVILAGTSDLPTAEEISQDSEALTSGQAIRLIALTGFTLLVGIPVILVLQALVTGGGVAYLDETDKGAEPSHSEALDKAQAHLGALVGAVLRATVIVFLFAITIIGLPFAIYRVVRWIFISQVVMIDGVRGQAVLARSAGLVAGRWWSTFGRLIVVALVIGIPVGILQQAIIAALPGVLGTVLSSATGFITIPYGIIALSLMYFDLRTREAIDDSASPA